MLKFFMDKLIIEKTTQYIYDNIDENISTKDICDHLNLSSTYVFNIFKKELAITPHTFILNLKISKAKKLLENRDDICKIALDLGFYDQSHLNRVFKKYTSVTPYEYRKMIKAQ